MSSSSVITNKEQFLDEVINKILPSADKVSFLVGFFYFSGFQQIYKNLVGKKVRILIGMDVEQQDRVSIAVANRVCRDSSECDQAPSPSAIWTAKEAAFKSLRGTQQPTTISQLVIGNWNPIAPHLFTFELQNFLEFQIQKGLGITYSKDSFQIALFICQNAVCR